MSQYSESHQLNPFWILTLANLKIESLKIALDLKLFDLLEEPQSCSALAKQRQVDKAGLQLLMQCLWSLKLLQKSEDDCYSNTELSQQFFRTQSLQYCGDSFMFRQNTLAGFSRLLQAKVKAGVSPTKIGTHDGWANAAKVQLAQEQIAVSAETAETIMRGLPEFKKAKRLLDIGCGPGLISRHLAEINPNLNVTLFDLHSTIEVAQENFDTPDLVQRSHFISGDFTKDDLGHAYDLIWCSSVFYFVPDLETFLKRVYNALRPGGVFVSLHVELPSTPDESEEIYFFYLPLLMQEKQILKEGETIPRLNQAGFYKIETQTVLTMPMTPMKCLIARKLS